MATAEQLIEEVGDTGVSVAVDGPSCVNIRYRELGQILRELITVKEQVWPRVTPSFQIDTILEQAATLLEIGGVRD